MSEIKFKAYTFGGWEVKPKNFSVEDYYYADVFDIDSRSGLEDFQEMAEIVAEQPGFEDFFLRFLLWLNLADICTLMRLISTLV